MLSVNKVVLNKVKAIICKDDPWSTPKIILFVKLLSTPALPEQ